MSLSLERPGAGLGVSWPRHNRPELCGAQEVGWVATPSFAEWLSLASSPSVPLPWIWSCPHLPCLDYCRGLPTAMSAAISLPSQPALQKPRAGPVSPC